MLVRRFSNPTYNRSRSLDLFNDFFNSLEKDETKEIFDFSPSVNTREGKEAYHIDIDLPGIKKEDVDISVEKNVLTISGKREISNEVKEEDYYKIESSYGSFSRSFTLPEKIDVENIRAASDNGVLEIIIPKLSVVTDSTKKIEIQ
ncbi:Hsp20/alpha crystallin family protein [Sulfurimonas sp. SAG-AH-194-L11]|nr:Hsp20/alpha crystallin family protein [Sulfurimonas sp. SAG-AH-194-L11]MDF1876540.1 Hsp20/alpha crystallin family protein [Sulfurimonas sp. SAG-AH-194-L11]